MGSDPFMGSFLFGKDCANDNRLYIIMGDDMRDEGLWIQPFVEPQGALVVI
jgi:hypothetical protein